MALNMKRYKNNILSILLLAFTFLVVHDYVVLNTSPEMGFYDSEDMGIHLESNKDIFSDIHDDIHTMFEISLYQVELFLEATSNLKPRVFEVFCTSYISLIPVKPPLI